MADEEQQEQDEENEEEESSDAQEASAAEEEAADEEQDPEVTVSDAGDEDEEGEEDASGEEGTSEETSEPSGGGGRSDDGRDQRGGEEFEESVVHVNRCCKVVQGGKVFSFSALVVAGNRNGKISYGFGKANQVPQAIQKAIQESRDRVIDVPIVHGTIPHRVELEYCSTELLLRPASPGTGVIASLPVRTTVNLAGITDLLTKIYGSTNPINCVKAVYEGLKSLRTKEEIEELRDVKIT